MVKIVSITTYKDKMIIWRSHSSSPRFWIAESEGDTFYLRMNNFPEEPLYTFISKSVLEDIDDLPERWILE